MLVQSHDCLSIIKMCTYAMENTETGSQINAKWHHEKPCSHQQHDFRLKFVLPRVKLLATTSHCNRWTVAWCHQFNRTGLRQNNLFDVLGTFFASESLQFDDFMQKKCKSSALAMNIYIFVALSQWYCLLLECYKMCRYAGKYVWLYHDRG